MHVCHAIYRLGWENFFLPIVTHLKYGFFINLNSIITFFSYDHLKRDFILKKWSRNDEFLLAFCDATSLWLKGTIITIYKATNLFTDILPDNLQQYTLMELLPLVRHNKTVLLYT